jgi:hypothetical protein
MMYLQNFVKIGSGIQNLLVGDSHTDKKVMSEANFYVFKTREVR